MIAVGMLVTAAATSVTDYYALRAWRQQQADRKPVVELRHQCLGTVPSGVTTRNRLAETSALKGRFVFHPRGSTPRRVHPLRPAQGRRDQ